MGEFALVCPKGSSWWQKAAFLDGRWHCSSSLPPHSHAPEDVDVRPLVVIDPEDREQVERLFRILVSLSHLADAERVQAALREFAAPSPPQPEEPTGLGAVVEDSEGNLWVNFRDPAFKYAHEKPWVLLHDGSYGAEWKDVRAVTVHWEGKS